MDAARMVSEGRRRHGLDQRTLARRAGTSQAYISRIERGAVSPSLTTLDRLLRAMGERLEVRAVPGSREEDHAAPDRLTPAERVAEAAELSHVLTRIASSRPM